MTAFDEVFAEVAKREYAAFALRVQRKGPETHFVFRELFCSRPRCDCRTVVILAVQADRRHVGAVIHYSFDPPKAKNQPQVFLDPSTEGPVAEALRSAFEEHIRSEGYRRTLLDHYAMWRSAVDDPSHPSHGRVLSLTGRNEPRQPRAAGKRAKKPAPTTGVELAIAQRARGADQKAQKRFTRLVRKVEGLRARVRAWHDQRPAIDRGLALYQAELATQRDLARQFVEALDKVLADPRLAKKHRPTLRRIVCSIARDLIEDGYQELKTIHDRHAPRSYDSEAASEETAGVASLKAMMEVMGMDLEGADLRSFDDLAAFTERQLAEEEAAPPRRGVRRKKTPKQLERETLAEAQQRDASKALQDVFRKLAVALHPDLERDQAEQARKTALMQEVNAAYAKKDLLRLLELQLRFERVDENARDIAEERLVHYTRILDDQARQLAAELEDLELPFRIQLDRPPPQHIGPNDVSTALERDTQDLRETIVFQREDLAALADPQRLQAWLRTLPAVSRGGEMPF